MPFLKTQTNATEAGAENAVSVTAAVMSVVTFAKLPVY